MKSNVFSLTLCVLVNCTWLLLGLANLCTEESGAPNKVLLKCGGATGLLVSFTAWYLMYEGLANRQNRYVYLSMLEGLRLTEEALFCHRIPIFHGTQADDSKKHKIDKTHRMKLSALETNETYFLIINTSLFKICNSS